MVKIVRVEDVEKLKIEILEKYAPEYVGVANRLVDKILSHAVEMEIPVKKDTTVGEGEAGKRIAWINQGWNECRQMLLDNLEGKK